MPTRGISKRDGTNTVSSIVQHALDMVDDTFAISEINESKETSNPYIAPLPPGWHVSEKAIEIVNQWMEDMNELTEEMPVIFEEGTVEQTEEFKDWVSRLLARENKFKNDYQNQLMEDNGGVIFWPDGLKPAPPEENTQSRVAGVGYITPDGYRYIDSCVQTLYSTCYFYTNVLYH